MFDKLKKLLGFKDSPEQITEIVEFHDDPSGKQLEQRRIFESQEKAKKAKWEAENKLKLKHDACNLYLKPTAFAGTYEQFLSQRQLKYLTYLQAAQMSPMMASALQNSSYYDFNSFGASNQSKQGAQNVLIS